MDNLRRVILTIAAYMYHNLPTKKNHLVLNILLYNLALAHRPYHSYDEANVAYYSYRTKEPYNHILGQ